MISNNRNLAIIPARGGSKRIPNKNIIDFLGKPIIAYSLEAASGSKLFNHIHVSTDSHLIASVSDELGYKVDFMRPDFLSDDHTGLLPVLKWVLAQYELLGMKFDSVSCIYPAAPLILASDLVSAYSLFNSHGRIYPLLTFSDFPVPIEWGFRDNGDGFFTPVMPDKLQIRSQDLSTSYYDTGTFAIYPIHMLTSANLTSLNTLAYILPRSRAVDIDTYEDLEYAKSSYVNNINS